MAKPQPQFQYPTTTFLNLRGFSSILAYPRDSNLWKWKTFWLVIIFIYDIITDWEKGIRILM